MSFSFKSVHFIGIGGIGMSAIAKVLLEKGYQVSGSDLKVSKLTDSLKQLGGDIKTGHKAENVKGKDLVVFSTAVPEDNPEFKAAREYGIPMLKRAEMLSLLMQDYYKIAVAGTHGKTTTTSMITQILRTAGLKPTWIIGGEVNDFGSNGGLGEGKFFVAEADESDASFLELSPDLAVLTSMDVDVNLNIKLFESMDFNYPRIAQKVKELFLDFLNCVGNDNGVVLCSDNDNIRSVLPQIERAYLTYGTFPPAMLMAKNISFSGFNSSCQVYYKGELLGDLKLQIPGLHNILNALAACGVGLKLGLDFETMAAGLAKFQGVVRRFQILGEEKGVIVVDDYAHNPVKISSALKAARNSGRKRVIAVFQPHRYTRTKLLMDQFKTIFADTVDLLIVTEIYPAGEKFIPGISGEKLAAEIKASQPQLTVQYLPEKQEIIDFLLSQTQPGDLVITLGAGDIDQTAFAFAKALQSDPAERPLSALPK